MKHIISEGDIIEYTQYGIVCYAYVLEVHPATSILGESYRCMTYNPETEQKECDIWLLEWHIVKKVDPKGRPVCNTWEELLTV
jgi:hypothetical protein